MIIQDVIMMIHFIKRQRRPIISAPNNWTRHSK
ncbi:hypothetical protein RDI58_017859 [Solanum bulbocastanum]|uniref:Uncharacterized protein n=1 Tax=Solanum bulbocastanum TaxID=147425 RepID=A0AAN8Y982_SOLBU